MYLDWRLWSFTRGVRLRIAGTVALGLLQVMAGIGRLALLGWLLARVFRGASLESLAVPILMTAAVIVVRGGLEYARAMIAHRTTAIVQARLRQTIYDRVVALGPAHFTRARTGDVLVSMVEGVQQLEVYFGQYLPQLAVAALTPVLIFAFVAALDLPIALVLLGATIVTLLAPALWHRTDSRASLARSKAYSAFAAEFLDSIQGLATLKAFGQSAARLTMLETRGWALFRSTMWVLGTNTLARGITDTGIAVGAAVALGWGAYRVRAGEMDLSVLLVILMLGVEVFRPLRELRVLLHQGMLGLSAAQGIFSILDAQPAVRDGAARPVGRRRLVPTVEFDRVTFAYPGGRHPAHEGLSFTVGAGERVGIVGPSGSGKSTIARLLLRFYDPQGGRVLVGGHDVSTLPLAELRGAIAVVSQDTYLFHGTVEDNLRMGKPDATPAELGAAARAANAHEFIERLPQGYHTVVGERGVRLSGGQRQRVAIARALLRDTPILILDEALSSVDAESEAVIQEALDRLMQGRTTLIFAHRLSSVVGADRIVALEDGRVAESGRHTELMARRGAYYRLMAGQARDGLAAADFIDAVEAAALDPNGDTAPGPGVERRPEEAAAVDGIVRAEGLGWRQVIEILLSIVAPHRGRLVVTFLLGVARVVSLIGVGVVSAVLARARIDRLGSRPREASGEMNAHAVDTVQGLAEIVAFQQEGARGLAFAARARAYVEARLPFLEDLTRQTVLQEMATGLGGLAVVTAGATLVAAGHLDAGVLPLLTLLAMSAFVPVGEIAQVAQDTYLFNDTLRNNILIARPTASEAEVAEAVAKASLDDFVQALPDGLDTLVGERGAQLSGGQRQRVAIARAFLKNAPVLILDEATSHLDAVNEQAVQDALAMLARDRTTLVIAHRLSTVRDADQIIVLDAGRVVETGSHSTPL